MELVQEFISAPLNRVSRQVPVWAVYLCGALPFALLIFALFTGGLGVDPVKELELELGKTGLWFLVGGLAMTPARKFLGLNLMRFRRAIGVTGFCYILAHLLVWLLLDIQLLWAQILSDLLKRPYITIGMAVFLMLAPLALTSNNLSLRRLGPMRWRWLHKLTYLAVPLAAIHFVMIVKGWQPEPFIWLAVILGFLVLRRI